VREPPAPRYGHQMVVTHLARSSISTSGITSWAKSACLPWTWPHRGLVVARSREGAHAVDRPADLDGHGGSGLSSSGMSCIEATPETFRVGLGLGSLRGL
jgi:hypothetical protein